MVHDKSRNLYVTPLLRIPPKLYLNLLMNAFITHFVLEKYKKNKPNKRRRDIMK